MPLHGQRAVQARVAAGRCLGQSRSERHWRGSEKGARLAFGPCQQNNNETGGSQHNLTDGLISTSAEIIPRSLLSQAYQVSCVVVMGSGQDV